VATGDFNGDGLPDLAVPDYISNTVTVFLTQLTQTATTSAARISLEKVGHKIEAKYAGDDQYLPSTSSPITVTRP